MGIIFAYVIFEDEVWQCRQIRLARQPADTVEFFVRDDFFDSVMPTNSFV